MRVKGKGGKERIIPVHPAIRADLVAALGGEAAPGLPSGFTDAPAPLDVAHDEATASADDPPF